MVPALKRKAIAMFSETMFSKNNVVLKEAMFLKTMISDDMMTPMNLKQASQHDKQHKLRSAYQAERQYQEIVELELNRSHMAMIDAEGRLVRISFITEH